MTRAEKYPETSAFIYYNQNPKKRITGDCVFRAISLALNESYNDIVMAMAKNMIDTSYCINDVKGYTDFLNKKGWIKHGQLKHDDGTKYTGKQFANWLSINYPKGEIGNVICHIGGHHIVCFKPTYHGEGFNCKYKCHDIWDSTDGCIGNWWTSKFVSL